MKTEIRYIELKTGFSDNGPAWIGAVEFSKTGQTIYSRSSGFAIRMHRAIAFVMQAALLAFKTLKVRRKTKKELQIPVLRRSAFGKAEQREG